jgi:GNAT superfamily N-acetyltransferase
MDTSLPYRQRTLRDGTILREFRSDAHPDELVWHQDRSHRSVRVLESGGWKLQLEEGLPFPLFEGNTYEIPSRSWHRVIRGPGDLKIEIMEGDNVRITESQLRKIIREELSRLGNFSAVEKFDSSYYTLKVSHPKTFDFPGRDSITVEDYDTSELRASIRDGIMEIVSVYVPETYRGKKLATQMIRQSIEWGHSRGYEVVGSGVYSAGGSGLAKSFLEKGEAQADPQLGKHKFLKRV